MGGWIFTEDQKIDIMYFLALNLEDNKKMKEICKVLQNFRIEVNNHEEDDTIIFKWFT